MKSVYHIAICDDEKLALNVLHVAVKNLMEEENVVCDYETFFSARDFYERTKTKTFDLIFLDVEMPQISGIKLGKVLRATHDAIKIIFVSGREDRVFETFEVSPFAFVRKSKLLNDLKRAIARWIKEEKTSASDNVLVLKKRNGMASFDINRIEYIESNRNYQKVFTCDGVVTDVCHSLGELENLVNNHGFVRVQRGYLISLRFVASLSYSTVTMKNGLKISVRRGFMPQLKLEYMSFLQKNNILIN